MLTERAYGGISFIGIQFKENFVPLIFLVSYGIINNRTPHTSHASDVSHGETFCIMEAYYGKTNYERYLFPESAI